MGNVAYVGAPLSSVPPGVIVVPVLRIVYRDISHLRKIRIPLALTSKRAVISMKMSGISIATSRIYCIGEETSRYLRKLYSLECIVPETQDSNGLAEIISGRESEVTIIGSNMVSRTLLSALQSRGINVDVVTGYEIKENPDARYEDLLDVEKILVGSSYSFEILFTRARNLIVGKRIYAIGRPTYETISKMSFSPAGYFERPSINEILLALLSDEEGKILARPENK
ncbi:MAG: uroporphyrinogen-III synthase [Thermoplasmata archaeon]